MKYHQEMFLQVLSRSVAIQCLIEECSSIALNRAKEGEDLNVFFGSEVLLSNIEVFNST
jgi:hypothetical protein